MGPAFAGTTAEYGAATGLLRDAHRLLEGAAHLGGLTIAVAEALQADLEERIILVLRERDAFHAGLLGDVGQIDTARHVGVADDGLRLGAARHRVELLEQALAHHGNAEIAGTEILLGA